MDNNVIKIKRIFENVYELPLYTFLNYEEAFKWSAEKYDYWSGSGCSAFCKICNNETLIARNMDLSLSNKPAYVIKTATEGLLKTIGITYFDKFGEDVEEIGFKGGLKRNLYEYAPFLCTDILNEKGFYIEVNMRTTEYDKNGKSKFGCSGTNPKSKTRVCESMLVRYLADRALNVDDALEILKGIDVYSPNGNGLNWNLCFLVADASGKHGVIEIAKNKIVFNEVNCQANFYLTKEFNKIEDFKAGIGRFNYIQDHYDSIKNETDMFKVIDDVSYFQMYLGNPKFDARSELVADKPGWTTEFLLKDENLPVIKARFAELKSKVKKLIATNSLKDAGVYWASIFTVVTNCNKKEMLVRFFENNDFIVKLYFDF